MACPSAPAVWSEARRRQPRFSKRLRRLWSFWRIPRVRVPTSAANCAHRFGSRPGTFDAEPSGTHGWFARLPEVFAMKTFSQFSCILLAVIVPLAACGGKADQPSVESAPKIERAEPLTAGFGSAKAPAEKPA